MSKRGAWIPAIQVIKAMTRQVALGLKARIAASVIIIPMERRLAHPIPDTTLTTLEDSRVVKEAANTINSGLQLCQCQPLLLNLRTQNSMRRWWRRMSSKLVLFSMPAARNRTWIIYSIFNLNREDQNLRIIKDHRDQESGNSPTPKDVPNTTRNNIFKQSKFNFTSQKIMTKIRETLFTFQLCSANLLSFWRDFFSQKFQKFQFWAKLKYLFCLLFQLPICGQVIRRLCSPPRRSGYIGQLGPHWTGSPQDNRNCAILSHMSIRSQSGEDHPLRSRLLLAMHSSLFGIVRSPMA